MKALVDIGSTDVYLGKTFFQALLFSSLLVDNNEHCCVRNVLIIFEGDNQEFARKIIRQR